MKYDNDSPLFPNGAQKPDRPYAVGDYPHSDFAGALLYHPYPFIVKILNGLKDSSDFLDPTVRFIPKHFTLFTVQRTIEKIGYWKALGNTFVLSLGVGILQTAVALFGGYGFARFKFRGNA